jgi:hypothetical protein
MVKMNPIISSQRLNDGLERHYVLPVESDSTFVELLEFVCSEYDFLETKRVEYPDDTVVVNLESNTGTLTFVLDDMTGVSFYGTRKSDELLARQVANGIEERILEARSRNRNN